MHWTAITNLSTPGGDITFTDRATNAPCRFYRAQLPAE